MSYDTLDTIAAIATARGGAARGIVRVSGCHVLEVIERCFEPADGKMLSDLRRATTFSGRVSTVLDGDRLQSVPCDLLLWPTERSYTREPVAELHTIGSPPLVEAVLAAVCAAGARLAEAGEFTLRAFLAGRLDLTQAEAVLGVIDAHGRGELDAALVQLAGGLARPLNRMRNALLQLLAELEAGLDFVEDDIRFISSEQLLERLQAATAELQDTAAQMTARHAAKCTDQVVLFGPPNVGKSSLFNALVAARGAARLPAAQAIVSHRYGTTRDYLAATIDLDGLGCELVDTAGVLTDEATWDEVAEPIHRAAQTMTSERRAAAAIRVLCLETASPLAQTVSTAAAADMIVLTKADLAARDASNPVQEQFVQPVITTSSVTGQGLDALCGTLRTLLARESAAQRSQVVAATADRCRDCLRRAEAALGRAAEIVVARGGEELVAAELRNALDELGRVVGAVYTDDLLDRIFKTFCIGK
jgi:tRNA modification GTPase